MILTLLRQYRSISSAHSLGFTLGLLALHPDCQERVLQEAKSFVAKGNVPVSRESQQLYTIFLTIPQQTYEDVCRMKYTLGVIYETLRLFPAVISVALLLSQHSSLTYHRWRVSLSLVNTILI